MDDNFHKERESALAWWRSLEYFGQVNIVNAWQKQLGTDFMKGWSFPLIQKSDSAIHRVWQWSEAIKKVSVPKKIDADILTDKRY